MQDRFAGDIGDFVKLAILRALSPGRRLGVAWWLHPDSGPAGDGNHVGYLDEPDKWRRYDPDLFDALRQVVRSGTRRVSALEEAAHIPEATFFAEPIPVDGHFADRPARRAAWFSRLKAQFDDRDCIFVDPDNGLEPKSFRLGTMGAGKSISLTEVAALANNGRALIIYHHHTRRPGGHHHELGYWAGRLRNLGFGEVTALRAKPFSPRAFFILNSDDTMRTRAAALSARWRGLISWHPELCSIESKAEASSLAERTRPAQ
jgi:hypothetical protein